MILVDVLHFKDPDPGARTVPDPQHCFALIYTPLAVVGSADPAQHHVDAEPGEEGGR